jgi:enediyne biosynthesis protein E4
MPKEQTTSMRNIYPLFLLFIACCHSACQQDKPLFELLDSKSTGIEFANTIVENDSLNILDSEFIYNGGGVAVGDVNGDGLDDIYFAGNQVENKLYINKGSLQFEDVTATSHAQKRPNQWSSGVNMLDINLDGRLDIYVCNTFHRNPELRKNLLFVNQGNNAQNIPIFKEMAAEYGIDDASHSSNANFFDYDNDGDLDLFVATNLIDTKYPNQVMPQPVMNSPTRDNLFENTWDETLKHPVFKDVSTKAGILYGGYSHSTLVHDFNNDGYLDIYVANDYVTNDLLYINDGGTSKHFTNRVSQVFKHQPNSAMGSDLGDINNDGLVDMFTTEMLPYSNGRKKLFLNANNYNSYINADFFHYDYQYQRNMLQLNRGTNPTSKLPVFSDISFLANVQETDWSWSSLFADFDNDGYKDLLVTNGFPKDITDHDFGAFRQQNNNLVPKAELLDMIPSVKVPNFIFRNKGDLTFEDVSKKWGITIPSFTNGAAYSDLDNDGDLDLVTNNIDDKSFVYKNTLRDKAKKELADNNFLRIKLIGSPQNPDAFGTQVRVSYRDKTQIAVQTAARGYLSNSEKWLHFGVGNDTKIDRIEVLWQGGKQSIVTQVPTNQSITIDYKTAKNKVAPTTTNSTPILSSLNPKTIGLNYLHQETDYIDFNVQRTLPHKFSQYGPAMAVGDINGDGLDDVVFGGSSTFEETFFVQQANGKFSTKKVNLKINKEKKEEDLGVLLFDADNDGDNDLCLTRGSGQFENGSNLYKHLLCINDGKGNFKIDSTALGGIRSNASSAKAIDFDGDGDLDLFIGGRVLAKSYPKAERSYLLRNDSSPVATVALTPRGGSIMKNINTKLHFTDVTSQVCPALATIGLVSDALWTDFSGDNIPDLILAGEWMPLTFLKNKGGKLIDVTKQTGISDKLGWWNSLAGGDFDNDGDIDYVAGNFGQNTFFKCNANEPVTIYAKDFDNNGLYDPFISCYWRDSTDKKHEYFYHSRDDMVKQLVLIRRKFQTYSDFGKAQVKDVFTKEELKDAQIMQANWMNTSFIENIGNGKFKLTPLPQQAQFAPVYGILPYDYDQDGLLDILMVGNDYGMELLQGRADAFYGTILKNNGKNDFQNIELNQSKFFVPKDAKALTRINIGDKKNLLLATQNRDSLKVFEPQLPILKNIRLLPKETKAKVVLKNGKNRLQEFYFGSTFGSQESRSISIDASIKEIILFDRTNRQTRLIK